MILILIIGILFIIYISTSGPASNVENIIPASALPLPPVVKEPEPTTATQPFTVVKPEQIVPVSTFFKKVFENMT
jgi:hypothetical protein